MTEKSQDSAANHPAGARHAGASGWPAWLQIVRVPNLFTVPGDPFAGFLLAVAGGLHGGLESFVRPGLLLAANDWAGVCLAACASLLLYMCGLIDNDLSDLEEDGRERPGRPLPAGRIKVRSAQIACLLSGAAGLGFALLNGLACFTVAAALLAAILAYNHCAKKFSVAGPLVMGSCRALSLLLGASAAGWRGDLAGIVLAPACLVWLYVAAVTSVAAGETRVTEVGVRRWLPAAVLAAGFGAVSYVAYKAGLGGWRDALLPGGMMAVWAGLIGAGLSGRPAPAAVQAGVGRLLHGLLFIQFIFTAVTGMYVVGAGIVFMLLWFFQFSLARRFYST